jgi:hypothetical protein
MYVGENDSHKKTDVSNHKKRGPLKDPLKKNY